MAETKAALDNLVKTTADAAAKEEGEVQATNVARYDLDVVEVQSSIIADLAEVNRLLLEELENYRSMEDEDKQLLMMIEDIKEGHEDLERMLEP